MKIDVSCKRKDCIHNEDGWCEDTSVVYIDWDGICENYEKEDEG